MEFSIFKSTVFHNERTFRTPFKVTSMCFSPHNDLIAMGSKTGEVMMKRTSWKIIWKTNISMVPAVGTECKTESSVSALHFSPDGKFVAAATSKGILHLLDVESGKIRFSVKVATETIAKLCWDSVRETSSCSNQFESLAPRLRNTMDDAVRLAQTKPEISREEIGFVYQRLDEDGSTFKHEEGHKEALEKTYISSATFNESLRNTVLLAAQEDNKIHVLIAGVFPYMQIDVTETLMQYNQGAVLFYDMHYSHAFGGVSFLATTYGPYLDCYEKEMRPPNPVPKKPGQGCHTLLFNVKLEINPALWDAAFRYIRLLFGYNLFTISLDTTKRNWEGQISTLHSRFDTKTKALKIGDVLLEMLLSGSTDAAGEAFLERGLGMDGLQGIREFTEKHLAEVCRLARGQLASAARNLCFQRCEFANAIERAEQHALLESDDSFLYDEEPSIPQKENNPWLDELEKNLNVVELKVRLLGVQCLTMIQELSHLTKWISLTKPFAKTMKVNALMKIKRMDIATILYYVVSNFIPDSEYAKSVTLRLFNLTQLIDTQKEEDSRNKFNEVEYLERLEAAAEKERKELVDTFQVKTDRAQVCPGTDVNVITKSERENAENQAQAAPAPVEAVIAGEEEVEPSCDLDRVGSFFANKLSAKALQVLPTCSETFDSVLGDRGSWQNSEQIKKMGLLSALESLADILSNPQRIHCDKSGNAKKPEVHFIHEIASDAAHRGFLDGKICNTSPANHRGEPSNSDDSIDYNGAISVSVVEKNLLSTTVLFPKINCGDGNSGRSNEYAPTRTVYQFQSVTAEAFCGTTSVAASKENSGGAGEPMEVDENELRIDVTSEQLHPQYDNLIEYDRVFHLHHQHLLILGKFTSNQEGSGRATRMIRYMAEDKKFFVHSAENGKTETVIESMVVHPTSQLCAFLHEDGSKITIGDLKPEKPVTTPEKKKTNRKTFRDYQRRRERYREDIGVGNLTDIQYDVLVQEAMDCGRDPNGSDGEYDDEDY